MIDLFVKLLANETEIVVTWTEPKKHTDIDALVYYGQASSSLNQKVKAKSEYFKDDKTKYTTFRAVLTGLEPDTKYRKINSL